MRIIIWIEFRRGGKRASLNIFPFRLNVKGKVFPLTPTITAKRWCGQKCFLDKWIYFHLSDGSTEKMKFSTRVNKVNQCCESQLDKFLSISTIEKLSHGTTFDLAIHYAMRFSEFQTNLNFNFASSLTTTSKDNWLTTKYLHVDFWFSRFSTDWFHFLDFICLLDGKLYRSFLKWSTKSLQLYEQFGNYSITVALKTRKASFFAFYCLFHWCSFSCKRMTKKR